MEIQAPKTLKKRKTAAVLFYVGLFFLFFAIGMFICIIVLNKYTPFNPTDTKTTIFDVIVAVLGIIGIILILISILYWLKLKKQNAYETQPAVEQQPENIDNNQVEYNQNVNQQQTTTSKPIVSEQDLDSEAKRRENQHLKFVNDYKDPKTNQIIKANPTDTIIIFLQTKDFNGLFDNTTNKNVIFYKVAPDVELKRILIYKSDEDKGVVGEFDLQNQETLNVNEAWNKYGDNSFMSKQDYNNYFYGCENAHVFIVKQAYKYSKPKKLIEYRSDISTVVVSYSSFRYVK